MAITFITGVARSGKSYFSVYKIWKMYKNDFIHSKINFIRSIEQWYRYYISPIPPKEYYQTTYTNINQFNFDFHPRIKKLDFDDLESKLTILHDICVNQKKDDDELNIEAKKLGLYNCLIVIDEGAHHFTKPINPVLVWWLTYHGHMFQDIHIISQHMDQIPVEYLKNGEFFYKVYPPSKSIWQNKFSIGLYSCIKFFKNCKTEDITIPFIPEVGNLYVSGKKAKRTQVLKKFIPIFAFLIIGFIFAIYNSMGVLISDSSDPKTSSIEPIKEKATISDSAPKVESEIYIFDDDLIEHTFLTFDCVGKICNTIKYKNVPKSFLTYLVKNNLNLYSDIEKISFNFRKYHLLVNDETIKLLSRSFEKIIDKKSKKPKENKSYMFGGK